MIVNALNQVSVQRQKKDCTLVLNYMGITFIINGEKEKWIILWRFREASLLENYYPLVFGKACFESLADFISIQIIGLNEFFLNQYKPVRGNSKTFRLAHMLVCQKKCFLHILNASSFLF